MAAGQPDPPSSNEPVIPPGPEQDAGSNRDGAIAHEHGPGDAAAYDATPDGPIVEAVTAGDATTEGVARAALALADALLGVAVIATEQARLAAKTLGFVAAPLSGLARIPVDLGRSIAAQSWVRGVVESGTIERWEIADHLQFLAQRIAPAVVDSALRLIDLTDIVRTNVDVDAIVEDVDIDAIVARVDLDAIVDRIDIDAIVDRVDIDAIVAGVDLDAIVDRIDIDAIAARIDIDAILDRVDVNAVVGRADMDAIIARIDLIGLAEFVVEGIDLPGIIRSSTGSMASEGIREVRRQGITADERVAHLVDRLLRRPDRSPGSTNHVPAALPSAPADDDRSQPASGAGPDAT